MQETLRAALERPSKVSEGDRFFCHEYGRLDLEWATLRREEERQRDMMSLLRTLAREGGGGGPRDRDHSPRRDRSPRRERSPRRAANPRRNDAPYRREPARGAYRPLSPRVSVPYEPVVSGAFCSQEQMNAMMDALNRASAGGGDLTATLSQLQQVTAASATPSGAWPTPP